MGDKGGGLGVWLTGEEKGKIREVKGEIREGELSAGEWGGG